MRDNIIVIYMSKLLKEQTLVIFKPDVIQRQIAGELISRFERKGFKIVGMKMTWPSKELMKKHYTDDPAYLTEVGEKAITNAKERGEEVKEHDPYKIGAMVRDWNVEYLSCGPVVALVLEGPHIIESVRKMVGGSNPLTADVGTIRSDYSPDSFVISNMQGRTTRTIIHASDSVENANREIPLWFKKDEIYNYETAIEKVLFDAGWSKSKLEK